MDHNVIYSPLIYIYIYISIIIYRIPITVDVIHFCWL